WTRPDISSALLNEQGRRAQSLYCAIPATGRPAHRRKLRDGAIKRLRPTAFSSARLAPAQLQRSKRRYELEEPGTSRSVKRLQRMAHRVRLDHAALHHHGLARAQPALAVLEIDRRQQTLVERQRFPSPSCVMMSENRLDQI